ncbi:hypothetical protein HPSA50_0861 [Helicobacter pylori SouthAfrica50]|uniref:Uncharacterized protein n=1 Tax=Helicobacter pylori SouthAfrica50 TaxID=1352357 RepID=T2S7E7_HELPX|nr:hypothetical protein HPSA50_0861 [Helicobacter pylori SouthAfrica50]
MFALVGFVKGQSLRGWFINKCISMACATIIPIVSPNLTL